MEDIHNPIFSSSSAIRFLGLLKQPDSDHTPLELEEIDVVWSSPTAPTDFTSSPKTYNSSEQSSSAPSTASNSPSSRLHSFHSDKFGLSAALADHTSPLGQRKPSLNTSFSAATAARTILPVSAARSDEFSSPGHGNFYQSAPVDVPIWPKKISRVGSEKLGFFEEEEDEFEDDMLPPHEIVARSHVATFSVVEGLGRTLKGRDLRRVRNAVWQKTGFLD